MVGERVIGNMKHHLTVPHLGFSLFILVDILTFHSSTAFSTLDYMSQEVKGLLVIALVAARIGAFLLVTLISFRKPCFPLRRASWIVFCTICSFVGLAFIATDIGGKGVVGVILGGVLFGAGQGVISLMWLSALTAFDYRGSYVYLLASHAFATILCALLLAFIDLGWFLPLIAACIVMGNALLLVLEPKSRGDHALRSQVKGIAPRLGKGVLAVCVFAFVSGLVLTVSEKTTVGVSPIFEQYLVLAISGVVLIIMLIPALAFRQPLNIESSYKVALPLSALGFLILPGIVDSIPPSIAGTLVTTGYMMTGIVLSCTLAEVARIARVPGMSLFAATETITLFFFLVGLLLGTTLVHRFTMVNIDLALVGAGSLYLFVLGASWFFSRDRNASRDPCVFEQQENESGIKKSIIGIKGSDQESVLVPEVTDFEKKAKEKNLDQVEQAILLQLLEGRTIPRIAKNLYLSTSSVKYHTQKIYRIFDVHSRGELFDLLAHPERQGD